MQKRKRAARRPFFTKAHRERRPFCRAERIELGVAAALMLALALPFLLLDANRALLYLCVPVWSVLEQAEPAAKQAAPKPQQERRAVEITVAEAEKKAEGASETAAAEAPSVLIYHTHATEAYLQTETETYAPSGSWRTADTSRSVVAVGARLTELLEAEYGLSVVHDTQNFEPPKLSSAYSRSLVAMQGYRERYPTIRVFIDVHRDAFGSGKQLEEPQDFIELDGKQVARLMCVVGTGEGATGTGFAKRPDFAANLALAQAVTDRLRAVDERLARDVRVKTGRYNQHVSDACLLVEVGHNANTLTQALNAVPYLAAAIGECIAARAVPEELAAMSVWTP